MEEPPAVRVRQEPQKNEIPKLWTLELNLYKAYSDSSYNNKETER